MSSGRIESGQTSLAIDRAGERAPRPTGDIGRLDSRAVKTEDLAPEQLEALVNATEQHAATRPRRCVADFVTPKISDPTILQSARLVSILERLVSGILPSLEGSEELRALACPLIADEIARHRDLLTRLHAGIAA
jgi:hypothetical protein